MMDETGCMAEHREHRIVVMGLGYVGLPLAAAFAEADVQVTGYDIAPDRVAAINQGASYIDDLPSKRLWTAVHRHGLQASHDPACISQATDIIICVSTPLTKHRTPDMRQVVSAAKTVAHHLGPGQLVVLESTTYPGTTEELVKPILEGSGLTIGQDVALAFSPERIDPGATGSSGYTLRNTPKIVGGVTAACAARAASLYQLVVDQVIQVGSPRVAEMEKLFENIFRNVNIALVNEMSVVCGRMGIDIWEVLDAASTKPFGFMRFSPGPGVGGHCIPVDPFYLTWKAHEYGVHTRFIELAGEINESMPEEVVSRVMQVLNDARRCLNGARVLVLGVAYKPNISDLRESPALKVVERLLAGGANVRYHDPHVGAVEVGGRSLESVALTADEVSAADCLVVLTDHDAIDWGLVASRGRLVVDTRNRLATTQRGLVGDSVA